MNTHKNARLTYARRHEMVRDIVERGLTPCAAAAAHSVSAPTARKWLGRFLAGGCGALADASSRPAHSPRAIAPGKALSIVELRRRRLTQARIAQSLGLSKSTVGRVLARAGLSRLSDLDPAPSIVRYEHKAPGDLLHIDTKKLGRIERTGHRITGNPRDNTDGAGWEFLFVAVDDHARIGFTDMRGGPRNLDSPISVVSARWTTDSSNMTETRNGKEVEKKSRSGVQGARGAGGDPRRQDARRARQTVRGASASDHRVEETAA